VTLPSGKKIKILKAGLIYFTKAPPGLALSYETQIKLDNKEALRDEVTEIWQVFRHDADDAKVSSAVIMANEPAQGFIIMTNRSQNFVFERQSDGSWPSKAK
jgi:hypothetical protein